MGKYSNVSANSLISAAKTALSDLTKYDLNNVQNKITNSKVLNSDSKTVINQTFNKIINNKNITGSVTNLKEYLNNLIDAGNIIVKYQSNESQIAELNKRLYYYETETYTTTNSDGTTSTHTRRYQVLDRSVQSQINNLSDQNIKYERQIDNILS